MNLKHIAAAKRLLAHWSPTRLDHLLEESEIKMSRALEYIMPNNIKVTSVQLSLRAEASFKECISMIVDHLNEAVGEGSQLIVFPEYIGLLPLLSSPTLFDLCYQFSEDLLNREEQAIQDGLRFYSKYLGQPPLKSYCRFFSLLAIKSSIYSLAATSIWFL